MQKHTFRQILSSITAFSTVFYMGAWRGYLPLVVTKFQAGEIPVPMTLDDISWMVALEDVGNLFSPFPVGYLMDRFGRLSALRLAFSFFLSAMAIILLATSPYHLYLASFLVGLGRGIGYSTPALYVAEVAKPSLRGSLTSINMVMFSVGTAIMLTFGPYISFEHLTWASLVCPLAGLLLTFFIVESPYYYCIQNNEIFAAKALSQVRDCLKINENNIELGLMIKKVDDEMKGPTSFSELISRKGNRKAFIIVLMAGLLQRAAGFISIVAYAPTSLPADFYWEPQVSLMIFAWLSVIFSSLSMTWVDRYGRKPLMIVSTFGALSVMAVESVYHYYRQKTNVDVSEFAFVPHVGLLLFGVFYAIGVGQMVQTYRGELLPVSIRGRASAIVGISQSAISFVISKIYFTVEQNIGLYFMYIIFCTFNFLNLIFTIVYTFETKGKTLVEIQDLLNR